MFRSRGRFLVGTLVVLVLIGLLGSLAIGGAAMAFQMGRLSAIESGDADTVKEMPHRFGPGAFHLGQRSIGQRGRFFGFTPFLYGIRLLFRVGLLAVVLMLIGSAFRTRKHGAAGKWHRFHCAAHQDHTHGPASREYCKDEASETDGAPSSDGAGPTDEAKLYKHS